ncbi:immunity 63 family protein [Paenibacillus melissococcoides]|uniref:Immunity 63 family protein n=1 Tax=Paenibacillus melissococcoides TaxID=2912268 RepID=A0ABM9FZ87_9BACL|nr:MULTISPECIES: Imm63 family immunity protein [Paenibacillus]MEB9894294.1 Imm63 family immunity protein [Bacillus cereus]CAH8244215.1 immunity 63 family protein [Paenibacillus melissococcoides]CAH8703645.1 immunity 63 family protein [Paenibacillus melissococcoides]CAH8706122.1 immunity 63 family protein [Paenibacillus melissococcoides]GIO77729.1 hypothetical protein J6TS7_13390 [Paenibacillus dendritiformis]
MMHTEREITASIIRLLRLTSIYDDSYEKMVTQPFQQDDLGDLSPCVRIREHAYELVMYERGVQMLSKTTKNVDDVDLAIALEMLFRPIFRETDNAR